LKLRKPRSVKICDISNCLHAADLHILGSLRGAKYLCGLISGFHRAFLQSIIFVSGLMHSII